MLQKWVIALCISFMMNRWHILLPPLELVKAPTSPTTLNRISSSENEWMV